MKKSMESPEKSYVEAAVRFQEARDRYDSDTSNREHDKIIKIARKLRQQPDRGLSILSRLIAHENDGVRSWAAFHLLPLDEVNALKILKEIAAGPPSEKRFDAEIIIKEWNSGQLDVDWFLKK